MRIALLLLVALAIVPIRAATADPTLGRVFTVPTAWLPPAGAVTVTGGSVHSGEQVAGVGMLNVGVGLGGLASLDVGTDNDVRGCDGCERADGLWLGRAAFRMGAREDAWFAGMPALVLGVRTTFAARGHAFGRARVTDAYVVASRAVGPVRVHAGVDIMDAGFGEDEVTLSPTPRPFGAFEWTPGLYPRTSVMADVMWVPRLEPDRVALEWVAGWGVRYQALSWGSVELGVRHRQDEGLGDSTVMIRLNGVISPRMRILAR